MKITISKRNGNGGFVYIILSIIIAIVLGIIIYHIARLLHNLDKKKNKTETWYKQDGRAWQASLVHTSSASLETNQPMLDEIILPTEGVTFQYKVMVVDGKVLGSLRMGTGWPEGIITVLIDTPDVYKVTFTVGNQVYVQAYDGNTPGIDPLPPQAANLISETVTAPYAGPPVPTIIQRSSDLVNWTSIATNAECVVGGVSTFTDYEVTDSPSFWRLVIDTNVVYSYLQTAPQ